MNLLSFGVSRSVYCLDLVLPCHERDGRVAESRSRVRQYGEINEGRDERSRGGTWEINMSGKDESGVWTLDQQRRPPSELRLEEPGPGGGWEYGGVRQRLVEVTKMWCHPEDGAQAILDSEWFEGP